jgi:hypothetical protein
MLSKDKPVQGHVIYAEFRSEHGQTRQIFFTPDGYNNAGTFVGMKAYYRVVSSGTPRKQWRTTMTSYKDVRNAVEGVEGDLPMFDEEWANNRLMVMHRTLDALSAQGWTMVGPPLVVEASKNDMDDVRGVKTPTKILYRINQSRLAAGYPADLF